MIEILVKEYTDRRFFIVVTKNRNRIMLKEEFVSSLTKNAMQEYVFSLMEEMPETEDEYVGLSWVINRRMKIENDPKVFFLPE